MCRSLSKGRGILALEVMNQIERLTRKVLRELLLKWRSKSRYIIERKLFPKVKNKRVLWVGCAEYTKDYPRKIEKNNNELWTIDIDPKVAEYGAKKHIIGNIANADKYFEKEFFDIIFFIGLFGYGLDEKKDAEKAMKSCYKILKKDGSMIIHWSNLEGRNKVKPKELKNIQLYTPKSIFGLPELYKINNNTKIFEFYKK